MSKWLIAGGAGFIGTNMVKRLLKEGNQVTVVDNLSTGSLENIKPFLKNKNFEFRNADICDYSDNDEYDRIVNLACPASPPAYQLTPIQTMLTSTQGVYNLLCIAHNKKARFLQASTSEIYGDPTVHPQPEEYWGNVNCYGPRACYDESKRVAETMIFDFQRVVGLDARIVRIFNTYGPFMSPNDGRVVSNFIVQTLQGKPLSIYGDGSQTRSFCYVDDTVEGILKVLEGSYAQPLNVGNPGEYTMLELANAVWYEWAHTKFFSMDQDAEPHFSYFTLPIDDPKQRCPDITKMKNLYGWEPKTNLQAGIKKTMAYFKKVLDN